MDDGITHTMVISIVLFRLRRVTNICVVYHLTNIIQATVFEYSNETRRGFIRQPSLSEVKKGGKIDNWY